MRNSVILLKFYLIEINLVKSIETVSLSRPLSANVHYTHICNPSVIQQQQKHSCTNLVWQNILIQIHHLNVYDFFSSFQYSISRLTFTRTCFCLSSSALSYKITDFFFTPRCYSLSLRVVRVVQQHQAHLGVLSFLLLPVGLEVPEDQLVPGEHISNRPGYNRKSGRLQNKEE